MNKFYKSTVMLATTALGLGFVAPALAQDTGEDIVVTARRIEERLQDVPISITVFNQQQLDDRNVASVNDLATFTPSLQSNNQFGSSSSASFSIRGFVQDNFTSPSVGTYFADVIAPRGATSLTAGDGAGPGSMFDLQNVQVLKGPQGTLFGRNTTGGAILLVPQKPTDEFGGYAEASAGNFDMQRLQAVVNIPLSESARLRMGFDRQTRDGYQNNISGIGPDHMGDVDYFAGRISFVADLTPNLENYSILSYTHTDEIPALNRPNGCDPTKYLDVHAGAIQLPVGQFSCDQTARLDAAHDFYAVENGEANPYNRLDQWQFINTTTWDVSDNLTIKNIVSYAEIQNETRAPVFGNLWVTRTGIDYIPAAPGVQDPLGFNTNQNFSPFASNNAPDHPFNHASTLTEELQFQGVALDNRLQWQTGVYYEKVESLEPAGSTQASFGSCDEGLGYNNETQLPTNVVASCYLPFHALGASLISREVRSTEFVDTAIYAQGTYSVTDRLKATLGLRYTDDTSQADAQAYKFIYLSGGADPDLIRCSDAEATLANDCTRSFNQHSNATTGEFDLAYQATDNTNLYIKYARGYRQGLVNPRGFGVLSSFEQEQIDLYEAGLKTNWRGAMPGYFNVAIFSNLLQNQQLIVSYLDSGTGQLTSGICGCGKSTVRGLEMDGSISPFDGFRLTGALAYLDTNVQNFSAPPGPPPYTTPVGGAGIRVPLNFAPQVKYSITPSYTLPLPENIGDVSLSATYSFTDGYSTRIGKVPSYETLNLNLNWDHVFGAPVDLSLFGTNVTDQEYIVFNNEDLFSSMGFNSTVTGQPRMYGVRLRYNFGANAN